MKDIFIDNNIAKNFCNPVDPKYKKLIAWLFYNDERSPANNAFLVVSQNLLVEYHRSARDARSNSSIIVIIGTLNSQGRLIKKTNNEIKAFKNTYFKKRIVNNFRCNYEDRDYIATILLSHRKYALCRDNNLIFDLRNFPGFNVLVEKRPELLPYN